MNKDKPQLKQIGLIYTCASGVIPMHVSQEVSAMTCVHTVNPSRARTGGCSVLGCALFITASESVASAAAARCFASDGNGALEEADLHLWFHIMSNSATPVSLPSSFSLSLSLTLSVFVSC